MLRAISPTDRQNTLQYYLVTDNHHFLSKLSNVCTKQELYLCYRNLVSVCVQSASVNSRVSFTTIARGQHCYGDRIIKNQKCYYVTYLLLL